jgi:mannose-1-phosphate guanylyltransferase/mannose-6-phosphate isomerase
VNYAIVLAGGIGSRFWPLSRKSLPKQFLRIIGKDTFLEATIRRIQTIIPSKNIFIVTNRIYLREIKRQLRKFNIPQENVILEPKPLNTLPAISLCAQLINLKDPEASLLVLPTDHYIKNKLEFKQDILKALNVAAKGFLCLLGIKANGLCLGYGYIKTARKISPGIFYVKSFKEKPGPDKAKRLLEEKGIFWNAGIFCFKAGVLLREIKIHLPELYRQLIQIEDKQDMKRIWHKIKPISIDYGLMEKSKNLAMVKARFDWIDLGSWNALCRVLPKDRKNNIVLSDSVDLDSTNIFIYSNNPKRLIATLGLKDLIIVDTPDALLVSSKKRSEEIKRIVEILQKKRKNYV